MIMGDVSRSDLDYFYHNGAKFARPPKVYEISNENMIATSDMIKFHSDINFNMAFYMCDKNQQNYNVYEANDLM